MELWTAEECAAFLKCSVTHFKQRYRPIPDFPKPYTLPVLSAHDEGSKTRTRRLLWKAGEVRDWIERNLKVA